MNRQVNLLVDAFSGLTRTIAADENTFGSASLQVAGVCDGTDGVQWNAWIEWGRYADGLGRRQPRRHHLRRLAGRPLRRARAVGSAASRTRASIEDPRRIEVIWYRDAWQVAARPPITEKFIGGSPHLLHELQQDQWTRMWKKPTSAVDFKRARSSLSQTVLMSRPQGMPPAGACRLVVDGASPVRQPRRRVARKRSARHCVTATRA